MTCNIPSPQNKWSLLLYPGETHFLHGVDPTAGSWTLNFFKRDSSQNFTDLEGNPLALAIANPSSINFQEELEEVIDVQNHVTPQQIAIAKYFGTGVPLNQITPIVMTLLNTYKIPPPRAARILSCLQMALNDAFVITWHYKYLWDYPRPVQLDPNLRTVIPTPKFPAYPSGHSVVSATMSIVLSYFFPPEQDKLYELAELASISRLYGGVHFPADLKQGLRLGRYLGKQIVQILKNEYDRDGTMIDVPQTVF